MNNPASPEPELVENNLDDEMMSWKGISNLRIPSYVTARRAGANNSVTKPNPVSDALAKGEK